MPEDYRKRALAHYKQAAKYKRRKMKHKYMAHLLRGDQYMRASALSFGVPLDEPSKYGFENGHGPDEGMVYWHGRGVEDLVLVAGLDEENFDDVKSPTWKWERSEIDEMYAVDMVCHREITNDVTMNPDYSSNGKYQAVEYNGHDSRRQKTAFFVFRSKHTGTFISCNVAELSAHLASAGNDSTTKIGAKDVDDLIASKDCARLAFEENPFLRSVEDWRGGALLVKLQGIEKWESASLCEKFAYYDFALRRKKDGKSCTYTSNYKASTTGAVVIPQDYIALQGGCKAQGAVNNGIATIVMSTNPLGAVFCNGREMRSTSMVADDNSTQMSKIRARFILGVLAGDNMETKKKLMEEALGAKSLLLDRDPSQRKECERKARASKVIWPDLAGKVACTYDDASTELREKVGELKKTPLGGPSNKTVEEIEKKLQALGYANAANQVISSGASAVASGASAVASVAYAGASALKSAVGFVSSAK